MEIEVDVLSQKLRLPTNLKDYAEGTQNFVKFIFNLGKEWESLKVFASFYQDGKTYNVYLDSSNSCYLPPEISSGTCTMALYGSYGKIIGSTHPVTLRVSKGIVVDSENILMSSSLYNQLATQVYDLHLLADDNLARIGFTWIDL